ncbi:MAG TPA: ABC transporter substrate-binding protein [Alphaproteobacteria bacterium]|nr:ABC transporter substrate-binding protein [Alphaproteobacteria bacterium]
MNLRQVTIGLAVVGAVGWAFGAAAAFAQSEQFIPRLVYRTGPYAPDGIPFANGYADYLDMVNARDGGVGGVKITYEECETGYNNDKGVECYERLKHHPPTGASLVDPLSTGITYALIGRATADKIPVVSMGYGRADASYGPVFPYVFTYPATYWAGADAMIQYIGQQEGGMAKLKGKKIALVYLNAAYGKEPIPTLERLAKEYGYTFTGYAVNSPGLDQQATWLQIHQAKPDWVLMWGWGVMNSTAIKDAVSVGYPMDHFIGIWWSGDNPDVQPAGMSAKGYKAATFHGVGTNYPVIQDILKYVYAKGGGHGPKDGVGGPLYDRGVINAIYDLEAIRTAQGKYGKKSLTGEQVQWGLEHLNLTDARVKALGAEGLVTPIKLSCEDHEGDGNVRIQQWDGKTWHMISGWIKPNRTALREAYKESAMAYAKENNITPRDCAKQAAAK